MAIKFVQTAQPKNSVFCNFRVDLWRTELHKKTDMAFGMLSPDSQLENPTGSYTPVLGTCNEFVTPFLFSLCECVHDGKLLLQRYGVTCCSGHF